MPPPGSEAQQQLAVENRALMEELYSYVDAVRAAEGAMVQVAALSQTFSAHVAQQAEQIEELYTVALESSRNFTRGNAHLETTLKRSGGARRTVAIMLLSASLLLLLLDWLAG
jgi:t-SNARE complex subunit (syntaxin)